MRAGNLGKKRGLMSFQAVFLDISMPDCKVLFLPGAGSEKTGEKLSLPINPYLAD